MAAGPDRLAGGARSLDRVGLWPDPQDQHLLRRGRRTEGEQQTERRRAGKGAAKGESKGATEGADPGGRPV
ncbi:hypothetical protein Q8W71_06120 [Methylobacterium sp. NEAU 140]|uniref:hypothetical protein n=1 Tax=Methylobacterium sp. NEAU 140 TaxID=3064945 RepID=UPI0027322FF0|nr:hypothetical protein [Methylobacterium sp. NEAU 140]MDP4022189.1 hypothetical protein [Methylobacterium sp. NEAU 140]